VAQQPRRAKIQNPDEPGVDDFEIQKRPVWTTSPSVGG
jgi:hypothetical protein